MYQSIMMNVELKKNCYSAGETVEGKLEVFGGNKSTSVRKIKVFLAKESITSTNKNSSSINTQILNTDEHITKLITAGETKLYTFSFKLPDSVKRFDRFIIHAEADLKFWFNQRTAALVCVEANEEEIIQEDTNMLYELRDKLLAAVVEAEEDGVITDDEYDQIKSLHILLKKEVLADKKITAEEDKVIQEVRDVLKRIESKRA